MASPLSDVMLSAPARSDIRPPASPMITGIGAMSQIAAWWSTMASTRPVATRA